MNTIQSYSGQESLVSKMHGDDNLHFTNIAIKSATANSSAKKKDDNLEHLEHVFS